MAVIVSVDCHLLSQTFHRILKQIIVNWQHYTVKWWGDFERGLLQVMIWILLFALCCWCRKRWVTWRLRTRIWSVCCYVRDLVTVHWELVYGVQCHFVNEDLPPFVRQTFVYHWLTPQVRCVTYQPQNFHRSTVLQTYIHQVSTVGHCCTHQCVLCKRSINECHFAVFIQLWCSINCLQCFDTVGWASGRASSLQKYVPDFGCVRSQDWIPGWTITVKLHYNGLKGPLYPKSVVSKLGYGWFTRLGIFTVHLHWPSDSLHSCIPSPRQWPVC